MFSCLFHLTTLFQKKKRINIVVIKYDSASAAAPIINANNTNDTLNKNKPTRVVGISRNGLMRRERVFFITTNYIIVPNKVFCK